MPSNGSAVGKCIELMWYNAQGFRCVLLGPQKKKNSPKPGVKEILKPFYILGLMIMKRILSSVIGCRKFTCRSQHSNHRSNIYSSTWLRRPVSQINSLFVGENPLFAHYVVYKNLLLTRYFMKCLVLRFSRQSFLVKKSNILCSFFTSLILLITILGICGFSLRLKRSH